MESGDTSATRKVPIILAKPADRALSADVLGSPPRSTRSPALASAAQPIPSLMSAIPAALTAGETPPTILTHQPSLLSHSTSSFPRDGSNTTRASQSASGQPLPTAAGVGKVGPSSTAGLLNVRVRQTWSTGPKAMTKPCPLIDGQFAWVESPQLALADQTEFLVVGILGSQGVGKSYVMSQLAGKPKYDQDTDETYDQHVFKVGDVDCMESASPTTTCTSVYATSERLLLLDTQPVLCAKTLENLMYQEKSRHAELSYFDNLMEIQSLQLAMFILSVCHVVIVIEEGFTDLDLLKFIQTAQMLRPMPTLAGGSGGGHELNPDDTSTQPSLVFLQNKAPPSYFTSQAYSRMQTTLKGAFKSQQLANQGRVAMQGMSGFGSMNLFIFPDTDDDSEDQAYTVPYGDRYTSLEGVVQDFRGKILSMPRFPLVTSSANFTEKNWLTFASKMWEAVKKSQVLSEYSRLL